MQERMRVEQAAIVVLRLVLLVLRRRLPERDLVAPQIRRVAEDPEHREHALGRVVPDVGRDHVLDLALLVQEHPHAHHAVGIPLVGIEDDLRDGHEAHFGPGRSDAAQPRGEDERDQPADRVPTMSRLVSSHRSPERSRTWNGPGTRPSGVSRRRCGSETNASASGPLHRLANSAAVEEERVAVRLEIRRRREALRREHGDVAAGVVREGADDLILLGRLEHDLHRAGNARVDDSRQWPPREERFGLGLGAENDRHHRQADRHQPRCPRPPPCAVARPRRGSRRREASPPCWPAGGRAAPASP